MTIKTIQQFGKLGDNIVENVNHQIPGFRVLSDLGINFFVSGGYAMACLMAPRVEIDFNDGFTTSSMNLVDPSYYQDIDLYFYSQEDYNLARAYYTGLGTSIYSNPNCESFHIEIENRYYEIQIIKIAFGDPLTVFKTFDIVNTAVAIDSSYNIITHPDFYQSNFKKEIEINNINLENHLSHDAFKNYLGVLFSRINKYKSRYSMTLGPKYLKVLTSLKKIYPELPIECTQYVGTGSGSKRVSATKNLWNSIELAVE